VRRIGLPRDLTGRIGLGLVAFVVAVAIFGPLLAPHPITSVVGVPGTGPSSSSPLGMDFLGRDVLSRLLNGGRSVLLLGFAATALGYLVGGIIGLIAGYSRSLIDPLLMRSVDVLLAFPALLLLLVLVTGAGSSELVLVLGVALVQMPGISRIVRTATLEVSVRSYVEAAIIRGESTASVLRREVLPNILGPVIATAGLRFTLSVVLIASVNFLGLGLQPPTSDWGVMVSENRQILNLNPLSVLAPTLMLALLTIGITMVGDFYARGLGTSRVMREAAA
jgi:peptide/nickel transport system permease protein